MSVDTFRTFAAGIAKDSEEFLRLAASMRSGADLSAYAKSHGHDLSPVEAEAVIAEAHRELREAGVGELPEKALDQVAGGISALGLLGGIGAAVGTLAAAAFVAPAALATGVSAAMVGLVTGAGVSAGGLGAMVGGAIDLIRGE